MLKQIKSSETPHCQKVRGNAHQDSQKFPVESIGWKLVLVLLSLTVPCVVKAQVVEDNTLSNPTVVNIDGNLIEITGGTTAGSNLFHSFEEFSIFSGETAWFNNLDTIANIISRVTGGSASYIEGLIRANGTANLFLLNPNGIVFGAGAQLDIGGSFIGSTADSIIFEDGTTFSATNPEETPLLTISIPMGLQYGSNPGDITVEGTGNNLFFIDGTPIIDRSNRPEGLQVDSGQTIALVGGNVSLDGGNLTANEGRIEVGSVSGESIVTLTPTNLGWEFSYPEVSNLGNINLANAASLEVSGNGAGDIQLIASNITIADGSAVLANPQTDVAGGNITINATEALQVVGFAANNPFVSYVSTDVDVFAPGDGGNIDINTNSLLVAGGGQISTGTFGEGDGGTLSVQAQDIQIISGSPGGPSGLFAPVAPIATGNAGTIDVVTGNLLITDGARIEVTTLGGGNAGNIRINATDIEITGAIDTGFGVFSSSILAQVIQGATGNGGNIEITTDSLLITNGATIDTNTFGVGNAGNISVNARDVQVIGFFDSGFNTFSSSILARVGSGAMGSGGNIEVTTDSLLITDSATIDANTFGIGNAGNISVNATDIQIIGTLETEFNAFPSRIVAQVGSGASGSGGDIEVITDSLRLVDGGQISSTTRGIGDGGNVNIQAQEVDLQGASPSDVTSGVFASVLAGAEGNGGNVILETESLRIADGAQVSISTDSSGNSGSLTVNATNIAIIGGIESVPSGLFSNVAFNRAGNGGELVVETESLQISDGAVISTNTTGSGNAGNLIVNAQQIDLIGFNQQGRSGLFASAITDSGDGGTINVNTDQLNILDGATISVSNFQSQNLQPPGTGAAGSLAITAESIVLDTNDINNPSTITASTFANGGGNIDLQVDSLTISNGSEVTAETRGISDGGSVSLNSNSLQLNSGARISTSTNAEGDGGIINISADSSNLDGFGTGIFSEAENGSSGDGGNIDLTSDVLFLSNSSQISANTEGIGQAGSINFSGDSLEVNSGSTISTSTNAEGNGGIINITATNSNFDGSGTGIFSEAETGSSGDGGNIDFTSDVLFLSNNSQISANTEGIGQAGSINFSGDSLEVNSGSTISTSTNAEGNGGIINITATNSNFDGSGTGIFSEAETGSSGDGGNIDFTSDVLFLSNNSQISANTEGIGQAGSINFSGDSLEVNSGSTISTSTSAEGDGGIINISATNSNLDGDGTGIFSEAQLNSSGNGGNIDFNSNFLSVSNGAVISTNTSGSGDAGNLVVNAPQIELIGFSEQGSSGLFASAVISSGNGGTININTDQLTIQDGATISVSNFSSQNFTASETEITEDPEVSINEIVLDSDNLNNNLILDSNNIVLDSNIILDSINEIVLNNNNTESIYSSTGGGSNISAGGTISIVASPITIIRPDSPGTGIAGNIQINADEIILDTEDTDNPSTITASTFSGGGGDIDLQIQESLLLSNGSEITAEARGSGDGGSVSLNSDSFELNSGARISTSTIAEGDGGIINITADNSNLDGSGTGIFSEAETGSSGDGGNIDFTSDVLSLNNGAQISANSAGSGQAGSITLNSNSLEINSSSTISSSTSAAGGGGIINITTDSSNLNGNGTGIFSEAESASSGDGGNINISSDRVLLSNGAQVSANSAGNGQAGNINIFFDRLEANRGLITATSEQTGGGDITLTTFESELILSNNSLISTSVQDSTGGGGDIVINADFIWARENSDIRANAVLGDGGNIQINTETIFLSPDSDIDASSQFGVDGAVEINNVEIDKKLGVVELPETIVDPTQLVARTCPIEGDSFVVSGKGGLPLDPSETLRGESLWSDLRSFSRRQGEEITQNSELEVNNETETPSVIIEAQGWIVNAQGNIELVAQALDTTPQTGWESHPNCGE